MPSRADTRFSAASIPIAVRVSTVAGPLHVRSRHGAVAIEDVEAGYGQLQVLHRVTLRVAPGDSRVSQALKRRCR